MGVLSLLVKLGVDSTQFETGIKRAQSVGEKFGSSFKSAVTGQLAAALSIAAVTGFTRSIIKAADDISDLSEQLNLSTDDIQRLQILANETGVSFEKFSSVLAKFVEIRLKATSGDEEAVKTLSKVKVSIEDLRDPKQKDLDLAIRAAEAHKESGRSAETTSAMIEIYGIKLKTAATALAEFQTTADRGLIPKETINDLAKANVQLEEAIRHFKVLSAPIAAKTTGYFANFIDQYNEAMDIGNEAMKGKSYYNIHGFDAGQVAGYGAKTASIFYAGLMGLMGIKPKSKTGGAGLISSEQDPPAIGDPRFEQLRGSRFALGGSQDSLARIGGFTGFQRGQDAAIKQSMEQTIQLRLIATNTGKTAQKVSEL